VGTFSGGTNVLTGPVEFQVNAEDAEKAKSLLSHLREPS
jgi:hypothetical protein